LPAFILFVWLFTAGGASGQSRPELARQVVLAESSFAATMALRDLDAFGRFVAEEAVFMGPRRIQRGRADVVAEWSRYFKEKEAPFSWRPGGVEVLESGTLALSTGPVFDPKGKQTGTFSSIWRLEPDGRWRVIFDHGCQVCE
jgi:ketosteroid isomerase-like protein